MKRLALSALITIGVLGLGACGSPATAVGSTPPPQATAEPTDAAAAPTEPAAAPEIPTVAPAAGNPTRVEITLADNTIASTMSSFTAGVPYTFVISNTGRREHNFNITPPVDVVGSLDAALANALLAVDGSQLPPGGSATVEFTFPADAVGADLEFNCLIRRHYDDGMRLQITVTG